MTHVVIKDTKQHSLHIKLLTYKVFFIIEININVDTKWKSSTYVIKLYII